MSGRVLFRILNRVIVFCLWKTGFSAASLVIANPLSSCTGLTIATECLLRFFHHDDCGLAKDCLQSSYETLTKEQSTVVGQGFGWTECEELIDALVIAVVPGNQRACIGSNAYQQLLDAITVGVGNGYPATTLVCG